MGQHHLSCVQEMFPVSFLDLQYLSFDQVSNIFSVSKTLVEKPLAQVRLRSLPLLVDLRESQNNLAMHFGSETYLQEPWSMI